MKTKNIFITLIIIILAGAGIWYFVLGGIGLPSGLGSSGGAFKLQTSGSELPVSAAPALPLTQTYTNDTYHFTVKYPASSTPNAFANPDTSAAGGGDMIVIADDAGMGAQILVTPFDEPVTALTVDRIKQDLPDLTILSPQDVLLGPDGANGKGVAFLDGTTTDASRQIWFIAGKHLYQITAPVSFDATLQAMLNTWQFK